MNLIFHVVNKGASFLKDRIIEIRIHIYTQINKEINKTFRVEKMFIVKFSTQTTTVHRVSDINLFIPHIFIYRGITSLSRDIAMHYNSNNTTISMEIHRGLKTRDIK